jgi:hypothetical protein
MQINTKGVIMGVSLDDKEFLDYLTKLKISIGTKVTAIERITFDKSMKIQIDSTLEHISENVSKNILIKITK